MGKWSFGDIKTLPNIKQLANNGIKMQVIFFDCFIFKIKNCLGFLRMITGQSLRASSVILPLPRHFPRENWAVSLDLLQHHSANSQSPCFPPGTAVTLWLSDREHTRSIMFCYKRGRSFPESEIMPSGIKNKSRFSSAKGILYPSLVFWG